MFFSYHTPTFIFRKRGTILLSKLKKNNHHCLTIPLNRYNLVLKHERYWATISKCSKILISKIITITYYVCVCVVFVQETTPHGDCPQLTYAILRHYCLKCSIYTSSMDKWNYMFFCLRLIFIMNINDPCLIFLTFRMFYLYVIHPCMSYICLFFWSYFAMV